MSMHGNHDSWAHWEEEKKKPYVPDDDEKDLDLIHESVSGSRLVHPGHLIQCFAKRNHLQSVKIHRDYYRKFQKVLHDHIESRVEGHFRDVLLLTATSQCRQDVHHLREATKGLGTDELTCTEILALRSPTELNEIKTDYYNLYKEHLIDRMRDETSGGLQACYVGILSDREYYIDEQTPVAPAEQSIEDIIQTQITNLYAAGEAKRGTDNLVFCRIICHGSKAHSELLYKAYKKIQYKPGQCDSG
jgi:annexin A7/11